MRKLGQAGVDAAPNVTPLVDVFLVLMVVLMLAMPLYVQQLGVDMPQVTPTGIPVVVNALNLSVNAAGSMRLDGRPITLSALKSRVGPKTDVQLGVDKSTSYAVLSRVVTTLQTYNPQSIALLVR